MAKVLNKYKDPKGDSIDIMRGSRWGNPFLVGIDGTRDEVVDLFEQYAMWRLLVQPDWLDPLIEKDLMCCCVPEKCHGDVIVTILENTEGLP